MKPNPNIQVGRKPAGAHAPAGRDGPDHPTLADGDLDLDEAILDGRHRRSARSRRAIVDAFLELLLEGFDQPSSTQIADRAGVTQRTLFNQFGDMAALLAVVGERQTERMRELWPAVVAGDRIDRCGSFAADVAKLLEHAAPVRWALVSGPVPAEQVREAVETFAGNLRTLLVRVFSDELELLDGDERTSRLDALVVACDPTTWHIRRVVHEQSYEQAAAALQSEVEALTSA
ncbi:MAG: TetR/AcrR family transcriptional regulator [Acidimicrobiales bacterium]|nr:TetR/AcrR family transcriptional regulator [Acidimicrobiales bacterium]